ncbi:SUKH-3 domain-containing protein [Streptomyces sp. NPDC059900]|uniref:SUKH-3 domain-containing protein n=1 Tax=Streptomyces sp. NPDC059900 TaxID=3155816 RepID=UPI003448DB6A
MSDELRQRWSEQTDHALRKAGWFPGRSVSTESHLRAQRERGGFEMHEAARQFLAEFGDLLVETPTGPFRFDPLAAGWDDKIFDVPGGAPGAPSYLYPLGGDDAGEALGMAPDGTVYLGPDTVRPLARSADEALERLVTGSRTHARESGSASEDELHTRWSPLTQRVMRSCGWYPGRRVPRPDWEDALRDLGHEVHDAARGFLAEFGGLRTDEWTPGPIMPQSSFRFDPLAVSARGREAFSDLTPVGEVDGGGSLVGIAADGTVSIASDGIEHLAAGGYEAVEKLVMERRTDAPLPFVPAGDHLVLPHSPEQDLRAEIGRRWSAETDRVLRLAGWYPGRSVSTVEWEHTLHEADEDFEIHDAARNFLREFGGLEIDQKGPGRTAPRSPLRFDPLVAKWDCEIFDELGEQAGVHLYPVGDTGRGVAYLGMAPDGAVHVGMDSVQFLAENGDRALEKLIEGIR